MDAIPFIILLVPYLFVMGVGALFLFFNVFHLWRYGLEGVGTTMLIVTYMSLFAVVVFGIWLALSGFAWDGTFSLLDFFPRNGGVSSFGL